MKQVMLDPEVLLNNVGPLLPSLGRQQAELISIFPPASCPPPPSPRRERAAPLEALFSLPHQRETDLGRVEPECQLKTAASSSAPVGPALGLVTSAY